MPLIEVKYVGLSDERLITKKNWLQEGVDIPVDTQWDRSNRFTLLIDATDRMIDVLKDQGHFKISEVTDTGGREVLAEASDPYREPDIVVNADTGQRSEVKKSDAGKGPAETTVPTGGTASGGAVSGSTGKGSSTSGDS